MKLTHIISVGFVFLLTSCWKDDPFDPDHNHKPVQIQFTESDLFPEGVVYDPFNDRFFVSSTTRGDIGIVTKQVVYKAFITDEALTGTTGLEIDKARNRLLVCNSAGHLGAYDITTGNRIFFVDLATLLPDQPDFINDVAIDDDGNAYVTTSLSPVIYKVDKNGMASIFFQNNDFSLPPGNFGFNGIEYSHEGFVLVNFTAQNKLVKISLDNKSNYEIVALNDALNRPDGLLLNKNGKQLIVVNNAGGADGSVLSFKSNNEWQNGFRKSSFLTGPVFPTTATTDGKRVYVLYAFLNRRNQGQDTFVIQQVPVDWD